MKLRCFAVKYFLPAASWSSTAVRGHFSSSEKWPQISRLETKTTQKPSRRAIHWLRIHSRANCSRMSQIYLDELGIPGRSTDLKRLGQLFQDDRQNPSMRSTWSSSFKRQKPKFVTWQLSFVGSLRKHEQLKFQLTFLVIRKILRVSGAKKATKTKNWCLQNFLFFFCRGARGPKTVLC